MRANGDIHLGWPAERSRARGVLGTARIAVEDARPIVHEPVLGV